MKAPAAPGPLSLMRGRNIDYAGGLAGSQVGLNLQVGPVVFGAEFEAAWSSLDGGTRGIVVDGGLGPTSLALASRMDWLGVAAGRIGITYGDWLLFAKAGAAAAFFGMPTSRSPRACLRCRRMGATTTPAF